LSTDCGDGIERRWASTGNRVVGRRVEGLAAGSALGKRDTGTLGFTARWSHARGLGLGLGMRMSGSLRDLENESGMLFLVGTRGADVGRGRGRDVDVDVPSVCPVDPSTRSGGIPGPRMTHPSFVHT
jgi:hypothetical protein